MSNLIFSSVNKVFGSGSSRYVALENIDFEANSGELILVVGPSGSGKTTFLTIAGGLQTPTSGNVTLNNEAITRLNRKEQSQLRLNKIGFILQSYNLVPFLSVKEQFTLADKVKKTNISPQDLDQLLTDLDIISLKEKYPNQLSGGQKQRVAIARALYTDPEYILADEPTAALDTERSAEVMKLLKTLAHKRNKVIIVVTHDMRLKKNADKIYQIIDGRMSLLK
ncbi:ABC transporter ATP-binding protein [Liquorilactobacillus capillatus]|uniref:ABC transporter ATP-binding component n=1 Tax=Liquorilactobacillus capillatus DSM 19910 TaxID=1423731 RepID=A0A0R1M2Y8_9LACO|nr:ABC transporter ATP-binding protein [Liquorilactobacillus capillatus]KRL02399.1 ABC transporter ATP-binding component [Liquorilactobacillus capillatus DSM 19910]